MLPAQWPLPRLASCVGRGRGPCARRQVDRQAGRVVREVVGVLPPPSHTVMKILLPTGAPCPTPLIDIWPVVGLQV